VLEGISRETVTSALPAQAARLPAAVSACLMAAATSALAQRVEVDAVEVCIIGSQSDLLRLLASADFAGTGPVAGPSLVPKWVPDIEREIP
jgi:hypothetical protein